MNATNETKQGHGGMPVKPMLRTVQACDSNPSSVRKNPDFYKSGIGTAEDRTAALQWYRQAASHRHEEAENEARGLERKSRICRNFVTNCRMF